MKRTDLLCDPGRSGVYRLPDEADWVHRAAKALGFAYWHLDLTAVQDKSALLVALARALEFPDSFGGNWDALQDCLGDLSWRTAPGYVIVLEHSQALAKHGSEDFDVALDVFRETVEFWRTQEIPFWVFVGGVAQGRRNLLHAPKG